ncbi:MAG: VOC family protein [Hydrotalea sp.]|nr:VOC family protein [Hydrotalea sp.]
MNKLTTFLWFDKQATDAVKLYQSIFPDLKIIGQMGPSENVMGVTFELWGQRFIAFNGGAHYALTPAVSLFVECETQDEIDNYWEKLLADGGKTMACGWLTDKFGLSWQIIPRVLGKLLSDSDRTKADRAMAAMMKMIKLDIKILQDAFDGK